MQKSEFSDRIDNISGGLHNKDPREVNDQDIAKVLEAVGIECNRLEKAYSVYAWRKVILKKLKAHKKCVVAGMPGSGKSTQIPQYLYEAGYANNGMIVCIQSRKSAIMGISQNVAKEMATSVGNLVGYKTESSFKASETMTKILILTDTCFLKECQQDPDLSKYSCVILDEARERSIHTDVLIGVMRGCLRKRKDLSLVIVASSEKQSRLCADYFGIPQVLWVSESAYPVNIFYEDRSENLENHEIKAVSKAADIHLSGNPGDILIFLNSLDETTRCCNEFKSRHFPGQTDFKCFALHEHLLAGEMQKPFEAVPTGVRKILFASDYAEISAPFDNIKFVIDVGIRRERDFDQKRNVRISGCRAISKMSAIRRTNIAGRNPGGICYRLYSKEDFDSFADDDDAEIHRANLAPLVLKLVELGVTVPSFDFIEVPDEFALESAFRALAAVGAMKYGVITDTGKWISILPYDIAYNYAIIKAYENNLTYDAVVLSTLMYYSNDLNLSNQTVYDSNSQNHASNLAQITALSGDTMASLDIYKTWSSLPKEKKASWCRQNGINSKALGILCQYVDDTLAILRKELAVDVMKIFSNKACDYVKLRKIIFQANISSVSHISDEGNAGYKSLISQHVVPMYPDSVYASSIICPEWIVFKELVRDYKEYIRGITMVEETWVHEEVESGNLKVDTANIKQVLVYHGKFGAKVFDCVIGPRCRFLWELQKDHTKTPIAKSCVFEIDNDLGIIDIYSNCAIDPAIIDRLERRKMSCIEILQSEESEFDINFEKTLTLNMIKVVLGGCGHLKECMIPSLSNQISVTKAPKTAGVQDVLAMFDKSGEDDIADVQKFTGKEKDWGMITFCSASQAITAAMSAEDRYSTMFQYNTFTRYTPNIFETKVTWVNERAALIKCSPIDKAALVGCTLELSGHLCKIRACPGDDRNLTISVGRSTSKIEILQKLKKILQAQGRQNAHLDVRLEHIRSCPEADLTELDRKKKLLASLLKNHVAEDQFLIRMPILHQTDTRCVCFVIFHDPVQGERVCREMNRRYQVDGQEIEFCFSYGTVLRVSKVVKKACQEQLSNLIGSLTQTYERLRIEWKQIGEDYNIVDECSKPEPVKEASARLSAELQGEIVDCSSNAKWECLLNPWGQNRLHTIQEQTNCIALTDTRNAKIHVYGSNSNIKAAIGKITACLSDDLQVTSFSLKCSDMAMYILQKYGPTFDNLVEDCDLKLAKLDLLTKSLRVVGSLTALEKTEHLIMQLENELNEIKDKERQLNARMCSLCKGILVKGSYHRLEICNHLYCLSCLHKVTEVTLKNNALPLACIHDDCRAKFVMADVKFLLSRNLIFEKDLTTAALRAFISTSNGRFYFCPSINCYAFYEVTRDVMGWEFACPVCLVCTCTSCHKPFHRGMACELAGPGVKAISLDTGLRRDDQSRQGFVLDTQNFLGLLMKTLFDR